MKLTSEKKALARLRSLISDFKFEISDKFEQNAKNCLTCDVQGSCCLDAHFVNVHISRLEAVNIANALRNFAEPLRTAVNDRIDRAIVDHGLDAAGDTFARTYACPLFEKGHGCLVHEIGKPAPCITHACYENAADLPPDELQYKTERRIDALNRQTYWRPQQMLPIPLALAKFR